MAEAFLRRARSEREAAEDALAPSATRSRHSRGRARPEPPDDFRTAFERDRDRIVHSKAFRRLKHKTQVFLNPEGDHYVTRLTHTLQVAQIARALAAALGLNEALTEAIALGHDVGHSPFGHAGEEALAPYFAGGWHHAAQSVRIYEVLEDRNLTWEVRDGIRAHSWRVRPPPATPEGDCVRFADRIAYLSHDVLDAVGAGLLATEDLPRTVRAHLGTPGSQWVSRMTRAVVDHSIVVGTVSMGPDTLQVAQQLRAFLFERLYEADHQAAQKVAAIGVIRRLVDHYLAHPGQLPASYRDSEADLLTRVVDYVAGMTDRFALLLHARLFQSVGLPVAAPPG